MSKPPLSLSELPSRALDLIVSYSLSLGIRPFDLISQLGSRVSEATFRVLASHIALPDDDSILLSIEQAQGEKKGTCLVTSIDPLLVQHLEVVPPVNPGAPQLDEQGLSLFLDRFENLSSFTWTSTRLPPEDLCLDLSNSAKYLRTFTFDLSPSSTTLSPSPLESSPFSYSSTSPSSPSTLLHSPPLLRWDSPHLSLLPSSLTSLSLSSLSPTGIRQLSQSLSLSSCPFSSTLERLELSKTNFVDDPLLEEIGKTLGKSLKVFRVKEMGGTKLSDSGLKSLFEGCLELEEFEMNCVEGRFSKHCWSKITSFPPRLRSIKITYSESPPHKSWVLDHFQSFSSLVVSTSSTLSCLTISRKLDPESLVPGSHHYARHPIDPVLSIKKIPENILEAIIGGGAGGEGGGGGGDEEKAKRWIELDLDLWSLDGKVLKQVLEKCTALKTLKVCFDTQFKNLLAMTSSFSFCQHLEQFIVSIPLEHTPELQTLTPTTYCLPSPSSPSLSLAGSPSSSKSSQLPLVSPSPSPSKPLSPELPSESTTTSSSPSSPLPESIQSLLPTTRDWRRFLKKNHHLNCMTWTGRGGIGNFRFGKIEGKGLIKISFEPTLPTLPVVESEEGGSGGGERGRERQDSWNSSFSSTSSSTLSTYGGVTTTTGSPVSMRRRRTSSSSSSITTSNSPSSPTKSFGGGGGGARKYGSIDAAFSPSKPSLSSERRASTTSSEFGTIGTPTSGGGTRRKSSFDGTAAGGGQLIGSGWSGFNSSLIPPPPPPPAQPSIPEHDPSQPLVEDPFFQVRQGGGLEMDLGVPSPTALEPSLLPFEESKVVGGGGTESSLQEEAPVATMATTIKNPWSSVPPSVTSAAVRGWASVSPSPPRPSSSSRNNSNNGGGSTNVSTRMLTNVESSSVKMSRSGSSSQGGSSPTSSRQGHTQVGGSPTTSGKNGTGNGNGGGDTSPKTERRRRERGGVKHKHKK